MATEQPDDETEGIGSDPESRSGRPWKLISAVSLAVVLAAIPLLALRDRSKEKRDDTSAIPQKTQPTPSGEPAQFYRGPNGERIMRGVSDPLNSPEKLEQYKAIRDQWMRNVELQLEGCNDQELRDVLSFLKDHHSLVKPVPQGSRILDVPKNPPYFSLAFLTENGHFNGEFWSRFRKNTSAIAFFDPTNRLLVINDRVPMTDIWKAIVVTHESRHAQRYTLKPYDWEDEQTFCYAELDAHLIQNRLIAHAGGERYKVALEAAVQRMSDEMRKNGLIPGEGFIFPDEVFYGEIEEIFGPSLSETERHLRRTHCGFDVIFHLVEISNEVPKAYKQKVRAIILRTIYKDEGLLPVRATGAKKP
ncbi:MAG: hypothetical protein Q8P95_05685 [bacterium]|nr:hypothetical protein [bacterium]